MNKIFQLFWTFQPQFFENEIFKIFLAKFEQDKKLHFFLFYQFELGLLKTKEPRDKTGVPEKLPNGSLFWN